jgi:hypothetical protein
MMSVFSNSVGLAGQAAEDYISALLELLGDRDPLSVQRELMPALRQLVHGLTEDQLRRPEAPGKWSILQVLEHLTDQELVNAFRLRSIVAEEEPALRGYDQDRWAARLRYGATSVAEVLGELEALRRRNLRLLGSLTEEELDRVGQHSERGRESVRRMRALTAAHDLVHRRQIERIRTGLGEPASTAGR